jgi:glutamine synthetase
MADTREDLRARAESDGIEFFFAMFVDMHGKPCAKLVPADSFDLLMDGGAGFAGFAAGPMGQTPADPDLTAVPDPASYTRVPWQPELAVLMCDVHVDGQPWPYSPRVILGRQLAALSERGMTLMAGFEAEYFLIHRLADGSIAVADPLDDASAPCYDVKALTRVYPFLSTISRYMNELGWTNYANDHEDANGQFEQNFRYADAMTSADRLIFFRYMVHVLAQREGRMATFMPKPFSRLTGNGLHIHSSLWEGTRPLFADGNDPRALGLSPIAYNYIAGVLEHARAAVAVTCPTVNSYKRMGVGAPSSGATWAPAYVSYGGNNRTQMLRIPDGGRVENRGCDGSANPYLALTAVLASGMDGIDRELDPGEPNTDNLFTLSPEQIAERGIRSMPPTLMHAADELSQDSVLRSAFGVGRNGEDYVDYYVRTKQDEFRAYHAQVSQWEIERYLTQF